MKIKKNVSKIILIGFTILLMLLNTQIVFAAYNDENKKVYQPYEFTADGEDGKGSGEIDTSGTGTNSIKTLGGQVVGIIQVVGTIVAVAALIVLGIKYMMGSAEEKAEYKKTLFPYFIGAILVFAAANLAQMVYTWASNI